MAKKKRKLTPLQKEYAREERLLKRRIKSWEKTHRVLFTDTPIKPKRITKQAVQRIRDIKWLSFTQEEKEKYRTNYEEAYEERELPISNREIPPFNPPSETNFYNDDYDGGEFWWEDTPNEPVNEMNEYKAEIDRLISQIVSEDVTDRGREDVRRTLRNMLENSRTEMGEKEFYKHLKNTDALSDLQKAADEAIFKYIKRGEDYDSTINSLLADFAAILNLNRPITDEQSYTLQAYGTIDFDYY